MGVSDAAVNQPEFVFGRPSGGDEDLVMGIRHLA
jgi:hypothetical protein